MRIVRHYDRKVNKDTKFKQHHTSIYDNIDENIQHINESSAIRVNMKHEIIIKVYKNKYYSNK